MLESHNFNRFSNTLWFFPIKFIRTSCLNSTEATSTSTCISQNHKRCCFPLAQHSCRFGHFASSHTVFNRFSRINFFNRLYESVVLMLIFSQSGFLSIVLLFVIVTNVHSLLNFFFEYGSMYLSHISYYVNQLLLP